MKAIVAQQSGGLHIEDRSKPEPGPGMVRLRLAYAGICGSDMHYYTHGRVGNARITQPLTLGHEMSGIIDALGPGVAASHPHLCEGLAVTLNPSDECGTCAYCKAGKQNLCPSLRYLGSAAREPHVQGIMQDFPIVHAKQCLILPKNIPLDQAACVEPLGIALHALARVPEPILGKKVFITGAGSVGALLAAVCALNGAAQVIISDVEKYPLDIAQKLGATTTINLSQKESAQAFHHACPVVFEASGSLGGMKTALECLAPGGHLVHVGFLPEEEVAYPINTMIVRKEAHVYGTLRAYHEFALAIELLAKGTLDLSFFISAIYPLEEAEKALLHACDKTQSLKVLIKGPAADEVPHAH